MVTIRTRIITGMLVIVAVGFYYLVNWVVDDLRPHYMKSMEESWLTSLCCLHQLWSR
jgi:hypothetical protein